MHNPKLANIVWHSLAGPHAPFATGTARVRRYASGFPPVFAFADPADPAEADFDMLAQLCQPGEHVYCAAWSGPVPAGWVLDADEMAHQMVWRGGMPAADAALPAVRLGAEHLAEALALVALTQPGPFGARSFELGQYIGVFEEGRLVAMAGERFRTAEMVEVSAVCTQPSHQGRGLARRLIGRLLRAQLAQGLTPFLHVMHGNPSAYGLYQRMGFVSCRDLAVRVLSRMSQQDD
jgi:GNAT superfamily N-acetyltransferase